MAAITAGAITATRVRLLGTFLAVALRLMMAPGTSRLYVCPVMTGHALVEVPPSGAQAGGRDAVKASSMVEAVAVGVLGDDGEGATRG